MLKAEYGIVKVNETWQVDEKQPIGYSRVYYIYDGDVTYYDGTMEKKLKQHHIYIFPSNLPYNMINNMQNPLFCLYLHLDLFPSVISHLIEIKVKDTPFLKSLFDTIAICISEKKQALLAILVSAFEKFLYEEQYIPKLSAAFTKTLLYIAEHYSEPLTVEQLSRLAGYNPCYFIRLFKKTTGISPYRYVTTFRMKTACLMLENGAGITETAFRTGYRDVKTFARCFCNTFGVSPGKYKKMIQA